MPSFVRPFSLHSQNALCPVLSLDLEKIQFAPSYDLSLRSAPSTAFDMETWVKQLNDGILRSKRNLEE